ncbi:MAG: hypothetical protein QM686_00050 [Herbaspirillum sp.]
MRTALCRPTKRSLKEALLSMPEAGVTAHAESSEVLSELDAQRADEALGGAFASKRIAVAKGQFALPDDDDNLNETIARQFLGDSSSGSS